MNGEGNCYVCVFVVGEYVGFGDVEKVEYIFEVGSVCGGIVVVVWWDGWIFSFVVIWGDGSEGFGNDWINLLLC